MNRDVDLEGRGCHIAQRRVDRLYLRFGELAGGNRNSTGSFRVALIPSVHFLPLTEMKRMRRSWRDEISDMLVAMG